MAISLVQTATPARTTSNSLLAVTFPGAVTAGNAVFVFAWGHGTDGDLSFIFPSVTCTDDQFNSYTQDQAQQANGTDGCAILSSLAVSSGPTVLTLHFTSAAGMSAVAVEVSGLSSHDTGAGATGSGATPSAGAFTTAQADEILLAVMVSGSSAIPATVTAPSGWTLIDSEINGLSYAPGGAAYRIVAAVQTSYDPTWAADSQPWAAIAVTYEAASGETYDPAGFPHLLHPVPTRRRASVIPY
jgi:hypothetical protein